MFKRAAVKERSGRLGNRSEGFEQGTALSSSGPVPVLRLESSGKNLPLTLPSTSPLAPMPYSSEIVPSFSGQGLWPTCLGILRVRHRALFTRHLSIDLLILVLLLAQLFSLLNLLDFCLWFEAQLMWPLGQIPKVPVTSCRTGSVSLLCHP